MKKYLNDLDDLNDLNDLKDLKDLKKFNKNLIDDPFKISRILLLNFGEILICFFIIFQSVPPTKVCPTY